jgi:hypothetical protein
MLKSARPQAARLRRHGFRHTGEIVHLASFHGSFPVRPPVHSLIFEPYTERNRSRLTAIIEATYEQSFDLPSLNGLRTTSDVLNSYAETEDSSRTVWFLIRDDERDVGCLLIVDHMDQNLCELVYMGIVPAARGNGWGHTTTRQAQWITRTLRRNRLALTADAANKPALRMYIAAGFYECGRSDLFTRAYA